MKLWYSEPAAGWETARESWNPDVYFNPGMDNPWFQALPVGNGRLGAMVFGGIEVERIQLNEETLRSGGPVDRNNPRALEVLPEVRRLIFEGRHDEAAMLVEKRMLGTPPRAQDYQTLGDMWLSFTGIGNTEDYRRELDLDTGIATVTYQSNGATYTREVFASAPDQVIVVNIRCSQPGGMSFTLDLDRPYGGDDRPYQVWNETPDTLLMRGALVKFFARLRARVRRGTQEGAITAGPDWKPAPNSELSIEKADEVTILLAASTGWRSISDQSGDADGDCSARLSRVADKSYEELRATHIEDHQRLFRRVRIDLGGSEAAEEPTDKRLEAVRDGGDDPHLAALYFQYGRYLMIAGSRPGTQAMNLQGIWNEELLPAWCCSYTLNINT
ncbi:MAG: glycoside hydrolase family 95 protein, partial [Candidatus Latescibacteria bacterium]|nr:glycoside hydrolase family 95 protein [Candidatus Latescibacterota bacterium]